MTCPCCGGYNLEPVVEIRHIPVHCNLLWETREAALGAPKGDLFLSFCSDCTYLFNRSFDPARTAYSQQYENSLHFSPHFQTYANSLAERLVQRWDLYGKDLVEIGSGQGDFLRLLCELGENRGVGFDPSAPFAEPDGRVHFVQEFYSEEHAGYPADLILARHVLEHIHQPRQFLEMLRRIIGDRLDTRVFFEVPNARYTLRDLGIWDLIYEHCSYFTDYSLAALFMACGFDVLSVQEEYSGQFLSIEAAPAAGATGRLPQGALTSVDEVAREAQAFGAHYRRKVADWQQEIERLGADGRSAVAWGAGSKGVTFLNVLKAEEAIPFVVDLNPRKHGMYVAGAGQAIIPPEALRDFQPNCVIVMNPLYEGEIRRTLAELVVPPVDILLA